MYQAYRTPPISAIQYSNGLWGQYVGKSLFGLTYRSGYRQEPADQLNTSLSIEQQLPFIQGLSIKGVINYDPYRVKKKKYLTCIHTGCITNSVSIRGRIPGTGETESGTIV